MSQSHIDKFMIGLDAFWKGTFDNVRNGIKMITQYNIDAGKDYLDLPATKENLILYLNAAARYMWSKSELTAEEAIAKWSDPFVSTATLPIDEICGLMVQVCMVMRGNKFDSILPMVEIEIRKAWRPDMTVWDVMCAAPVFF